MTTPIRRATTVVDVSRPTPPRRWQDMLAPFELLGLAWSVPILVLAVMLPIGALAAVAVWIGRQIFGA